MRTVFPTLLGNDRLKERFRDDMQNGTVFHAYILEGAAGSGKHTLARQVAAALNCTARDSQDASLPIPCGTCSHCRKFLTDRSPDLRYIRREKDRVGIGVDAIRFLAGDIAVEPNDGDKKIYIIEDADTMTAQAQNALLLTLEEPPSYALFFLLCENASLLLETIRSRAPILRMQMPEHDLLLEALRADPECNTAFATQTAQAIEGILQASGGALGRAKQLLAPKAAKQITALRERAAEFVQLLITGDSVKLLAFANSIGNLRADVRMLLETALPALRDLAVLKRGPDAVLCFYTDRAEAISLSDTVSLKRILCCYEALNDAMERIAVQNANIRLTLLRTLSDVGLI